MVAAFLSEIDNIWQMLESCGEEVQSKPNDTHDDDLADIIACNEGTRCHPVNQQDLSTKLGAYPAN